MKMVYEAGNIIDAHLVRHALEGTAGALRPFVMLESTVGVAHGDLRASWIHRLAGAQCGRVDGRAAAARCRSGIDAAWMDWRGYRVHRHRRRAAQRGVRMAWPITVLCAVTMLAAIAYELLARGVLPDLWWIRRGYQLSLLITAAMLAVGLAIRIGNYRDQRDGARLVREDRLATDRASVAGRRSAGATQAFAAG